ncbi:MAG TPA: Rv3654c family TadE-like protein [Actinomycetota bacterium]|nr:Rv3654c family TadE-like protein [Actinomycetota bacterium]
MGERGSVSPIVAAALGLVGLFLAVVADLTYAAVARSRAQATADAAALAAAQELVRPSGRSPSEVARRYAELGGARLLRCRCPSGGSDVEVEVRLEVDLPAISRSAAATASARAVVALPSGAAGLQPWFVARLRCLFSKVAGLTIVSGFRTYEEQARLHRERPDLAAPPGTSKHERGLAADLAFPSDEARSNAHRSAASCGLVFPVPHEDWHVEPVGA